MALGYKFGQPVMMQLGAFQFGITTAAYQEMQRTSEWRWPAQERFGKRSALQFTGPGDETMSLPGVIYPEWRGGFGQVDAMRAMASDGQPLQLVDGFGTSMGRWVIEGVDETQSVFADAGAPRRVEFTLRLRRFPDDDAASGVAAAVAGVAGAAGASIPAGATGAVAQVQGLAGSVSSAAKSLSGTLSKAADQVRATVSPYTAIAKDTLGAVSRSLAVVGELQDVANMALSAVGVRPIETNALLHAENLLARANRAVVNADSASAVLRASSDKLARLSNVPADATKAMQTAQAAADGTAVLVRQTAAQAATIKG